MRRLVQDLGHRLLRTAQLRNRSVLTLEPRSFYCIDLVLFEKIIVQLVRRIEFRTIDRLDYFHRCLELTIPSLDSFQGLILPAIVQARVSDLRGKGRTLMHGVIPIQLEEL